MTGEPPAERLRRLLFESGSRRLDFSHPATRVLLALAVIGVAAAFVVVGVTAYQEWRNAPPPGQEPRIAYQEAVRARIQAAMEAAVAERPLQGATGLVELYILVAPDGRINSITVERSSGNPALDDLARRIAAEAAPFEPFPSALHGRARVIEFRSKFYFM